MKFLSTLAFTAVSAGRVRRQSPAHATINNVEDAWNDMVTFSDAKYHGCQCLNLLTEEKLPGAPLDDLDRTCLDWLNAIKCQRFQGGVCSGRSNSELPSYINYPDCYGNQDQCAATLCLINREFADRVNAHTGASILVDPPGGCVRSKDAPNYDSCCYNPYDIFSSLRYDSALHSCRYNGEVVCAAGFKSVGATCEQCPAGTFAAADAASCTTCPPNRYSAAGASECVPCNAPTDMVIQLDGSGSLTNEFWSNEINFVKDFVANFQVSEDNTRLSITQYNRAVTTHVNGFNLRDQSAVDSTFNGIRFQHDGCDTCSRIGTGYGQANNIFEAHSRPESKKVLVAFADGFRIGKGEGNLRSAMRALENKDVKVFLILVHPEGESAFIDGYSISDFTSEDRFGFIANDWNSLGDVAAAVQNSVCA